MVRICMVGMIFDPVYLNWGYSVCLFALASDNSLDSDLFEPPCEQYPEVWGVKFSVETMWQWPSSFPNYGTLRAK